MSRFVSHFFVSKIFFGQKVFGRILCLSLLLGLMPSHATCAEDPQNILFYGNSFTLGAGSLRDVPTLVRRIANVAGRTTSNFVNAAVAGKDFAFHERRNFRVIDRRLPEAENWDYVVMQNFSTAPTRLGDLSLHRSQAVSLYQKVADRSPDVTPVLFETWARAPGHSFYEPPAPDFPGGPAEMQQELRDGYLLAASDIDAATSPGKTRIAPVGDAWESLDWKVDSESLHGEDLYHAANPGTLLAALTIYATIYQDNTADLDLTTVLRELRLPTSYGPILADAADHAVFGVPEPSTLVLLAFASGGLLIGPRRTRVGRCSKPNRSI